MSGDRDEPLGNVSRWHAVDDGEKEEEKKKKKEWEEEEEEEVQGQKGK